jgi:hypothetical protein
MKAGTGIELVNISRQRSCAREKVWLECNLSCIPARNRVRRELNEEHISEYKMSYENTIACSHSS